MNLTLIRSMTRSAVLSWKTSCATVRHTPLPLP